MHELTAILLCGGKGERLRPYTDTLPKPLIPLNGKPLLEHLLRYLESTGINKFVLCIGYKAECIREFVETYQTEASVVCVDSGDASMTDRILDARPYVENRGLICYGDTLANVDISELYRVHKEHGGTATMTLYPMHSPFGVVDLTQENRVKNFLEKPRLPYWINIGYLLCEPAALDTIKRGSDMPEFLNGLKDKEQLFAFQHVKRHLTINNEKERQIAESEITEFFTVMDSNPVVG